MTSTQFLEQIKIYLDELEIWMKPVKKIDKENDQKAAGRDQTPGQIIEAAEKVDAQFEKERTKDDLPRRIHAFLDEYYEAYLNATPEECEKIRASIDERYDFDNVLRDYVNRAIKQFQLSGDVLWFRRGLFAISFAARTGGDVDLLLCMADLYVLAEEKNLNPGDAFKTTAKISATEEHEYSYYTVNQVLNDFENQSLYKARRRKSNVLKLSLKERVWRKIDSIMGD